MARGIVQTHHVIITQLAGGYYAQTPAVHCRRIYSNGLRSVNSLNRPCLDTHGLEYSFGNQA
eukprot:scaffold446618_cov18-Prasinocladus_malaysianus.AAC.1